MLVPRESSRNGCAVSLANGRQDGATSAAPIAPRVNHDHRLVESPHAYVLMTTACRCNHWKLVEHTGYDPARLTCAFARFRTAQYRLTTAMPRKFGGGDASCTRPNCMQNSLATTVHAPPNGGVRRCCPQVGAADRSGFEPVPSLAGFTLHENGRAPRYCAECLLCPRQADCFLPRARGNGRDGGLRSHDLLIPNQAR